VKIQEPLYQRLSLRNMDLTKKVGESSTGQSETMTDSYALPGEFNGIEKEVFQVLKAILNDFTNAIDMLYEDTQKTLFPDVSIKLSEKPLSPVPEHTILMLFLSKKGETIENPVKTFLSYGVEKPLSEMPVSLKLFGQVVEEAKQFVNALVGKGIVAAGGTNEDDANANAESGFVMKFSYLPELSDKVSTEAPQFITLPSAQKDEVVRLPEWVNTYHVSGKAVDSQYLSSLSLQTEEEGEIYKKLLIFISTRQPDTQQTEGGGTNNISQKDETAEQIGNIEDAIEAKKMMTALSPQPVPEKNNRVEQNGDIENNVMGLKGMMTGMLSRDVHKEHGPVVVSFEIPEDKNEAAFVRIIPAKDTNGTMDNQEWELRGTTLNTGFGQGELKSSPLAGFPLLPFDNDTIVRKAVIFVDRLNTLLGGDENNSEALYEATPDGTVPAGVSLDKLRMFQARSTETRIAIQNAVKKVFNELADFSRMESIGLSLTKNGELHLDTSVLVSQMTSNKEETTNAMKGLSSTIYERINYLMQPFAGMYIDDKRVLQLRAAQKDEGASLPDRELQKEQNSLEKRLNELKLLIDRSRLLTEWFTQNSRISPDGLEEAAAGP
jgi:hypothetical protein